MFHDLVDWLSGTSRLAARVGALHPGEQVIFSAAAIMLESSKAAPVGWSLRRIFQIRGNVAITPQRIVLQSNFYSWFTVIIAVLAAVSAFAGVVLSEPIDLALSIALAMLVLQRRAYFRDVPLEAIRSVTFGTARGLTVRATVMAVKLDDRVINITTARPVSEVVRSLLSAAW